jgi:hypothetical protein
MRPSIHLRRLLRIDISPETPYARMELSLQRLVAIIKSTGQAEVRKGAIRKILGLFQSKGKQGKMLSLKYLSRVRRYVKEADTSILPLFYSNDEELNALGLRYVAMLPEAFAGNDVVFYHVYRCKNRYRRRAMAALLSCSSKYRSFGGDTKIWRDLDLVNNLRTSSADEYFGGLELSRLVELAALYPCLGTYFKFTSAFLSTEVRRGGYSTAVVHAIRRLVGESEAKPFYWRRFVLGLKCVSRCRYARAGAIFQELSGLDISTKYKIIFGHFGEKMGELMDGSVEQKEAASSMHHPPGLSPSPAFNVRLYGLREEKLYKLLRSLVSRSKRRALLSRPFS